jgi:hypothetical protein
MMQSTVSAIPCSCAKVFLNLLQVGPLALAVECTRPTPIRDFIRPAATGLWEWLARTWGRWSVATSGEWKICAVLAHSLSDLRLFVSRGRT